MLGILVPEWSLVQATTRGSKPRPEDRNMCMFSVSSGMIRNGKVQTYSLCKVEKCEGGVISGGTGGGK